LEFQNTPLTRTDCKGIDFLLFGVNGIKKYLNFEANSQFIRLIQDEKIKPQIALGPASKELKD